MTLAIVAINIVVTALYGQLSSTQQAADMSAKERARRASQQQFTENFRELQLLGIGLLKAHDEGQLQPQRLAKDTRAIQRRARTLRGLMILGPPPEKVIQNVREVHSADEFDRAIRQLSKLVSDFAHNPIHANAKVFDTDQAAQAAADILAIVDLAKIIERRARDYARA